MFKPESFRRQVFGRIPPTEISFTADMENPEIVIFSIQSGVENPPGGRSSLQGRRSRHDLTGFGLVMSVIEGLRGVNSCATGADRPNERVPTQSMGTKKKGCSPCLFVFVVVDLLLTKQGRKP